MKCQEMHMKIVGLLFGGYKNYVITAHVLAQQVQFFYDTHLVRDGPINKLDIKAASAHALYPHFF